MKFSKEHLATLPLDAEREQPLRSQVDLRQNGIPREANQRSIDADKLDPRYQQAQLRDWSVTSTNGPQHTGRPLSEILASHPSLLRAQTTTNTSAPFDIELNNTQTTPTHNSQLQQSTTNLKTNGKFDFIQALKNFGSGIISPITSLNSWGKVAAVVGIVAGAVVACIAIPKIAIGLAVVGLAIAAVDLVKFGYKFLTANNGDQKENAFSDLGKGVVGVALSAIPGAAASRAGTVTGKSSSIGERLASAFQDLKLLPVVIWNHLKDGTAWNNLKQAGSKIVEYFKSGEANQSKAGSVSSPKTTSNVEAVKLGDVKINGKSISPELKHFLDTGDLSQVSRSLTPEEVTRLMKFRNNVLKHSDKPEINLSTDPQGEKFLDGLFQTPVTKPTTTQGASNLSKLDPYAGKRELFNAIQKDGSLPIALTPEEAAVLAAVKARSKGRPNIFATAEEQQKMTRIAERLQFYSETSGFSSQQWADWLAKHPPPGGGNTYDFLLKPDAIKGMTPIEELSFHKSTLAARRGHSSLIQKELSFYEGQGVQNLSASSGKVDGWIRWKVGIGAPNSGTTHKLYATGNEIARDLRPQAIKDILTKMQKAGFNGEIKLNSTPYGFAQRTDHLVIHGSQKDIDIAQSILSQNHPRLSTARGIDVDVLGMSNNEMLAAIADIKRSGKHTVKSAPSPNPFINYRTVPAPNGGKPSYEIIGMFDTRTQQWIGTPPNK